MPLPASAEKRVAKSRNDATDMAIRLRGPDLEVAEVSGARSLDQKGFMKRPGPQLPLSNEYLL